MAPKVVCFLDNNRDGRRRRRPPSKRGWPAAVTIRPISDLNDKLEIYTPEPEDDDASENEQVFAPSHNSFVDLNLSRPFLLACERLGFTKPSPLQAACLPLAMADRDICGIASTGSGKTAAFALPTLQRLLIRPKSYQTLYSGIFR